MIVLLVFAFVSGLVTILAPCIWPLLPIILSSSTTGGRMRPLGITLGIVTSFAVFTLTISYLVKIIPFDPNVLRLFAVIVIGFLGLSLVIPRLSQLLEGYVSRFSSVFSSTGGNREGFIGGLITGLSLGIVWSPCAGPILATIATLAATQSVTLSVVLVTIAYVAGVGIPLFFFATIGNNFFTKSKALSPYTGRIQQVFGVIMILTALAIFTNYDKTLQARLLDAFPGYSQFIFDLEGNSTVQKELDKLKGKEDMKNEDMKKLMPNLVVPGQTTPVLPRIAPAPEFTGITQWLNTEKPLTIAGLRGKVVLIDFWTYTCINCIRTLPHIRTWHEKYKDKGFVIIGVHTPEFEFEKKTENVQSAIDQYDLYYPIAQDNDFATWNAYSNRYWPAKYLIDAQGYVRYFHFGEGKYDETERAIQELLEEAGKQVEEGMSEVEDRTPQSMISPETYLGYLRAERFVSPELLEPGEKEYTLPAAVPENYFGFLGEWQVDKEHSTSRKGSILDMGFYANKVFLVITPTSNEDRVRVFLDGKPIAPIDAGDDVDYDGYIKLDGPRLYRIVDLKSRYEKHTVRFEFETPGVQVFAFTFG